MIDDVLIGNNNEPISEIITIWPDGKYDSRMVNKDSIVLFRYDENLPQFDKSSLRVNPTFSIIDKSKEVNMDFRHKENSFTEFHRETLIPHQTSDHGPALAVGDLNGDGLEDVFIGSSKFEKHALYYQDNNGKFIRQGDDILDIDKGYEEVDAKITDINQDGTNDLIIATGGNEWRLTSKYTSQLLFLNDGKGTLVYQEEALLDINLTACSVEVGDLDGDGDNDLVFGARAEPWTYGKIPSSIIAFNNGSEKFVNVTNNIAPNFEKMGMVKAVELLDFDNDEDIDIMTATEWGGVDIWKNDGKKFTKEVLTSKRGWWNFIEPVDYDGDGDVDYLLGNLGQNTRLKADKNKPLRLYVNDFDNNGTEEQILTYYVKDRETIFSNLLELQKTLPIIKDKYQYAKDFATASIEEVLGVEKMQSSKVLTADFLDNAVLINNDGEYVLESLPYDLQLTPYLDAAVEDLDNDGRKDILLVGNYFGSNIQMGRYDADYGTILSNKGKGIYEKANTKGIKLKGVGRYIEKLQNNKFIVAVNNDSLKVLSIKPIK